MLITYLKQKKIITLLYISSYIICIFIIYFFHIHNKNINKKIKKNQNLMLHELTIFKNKSIKDFINLFSKKNLLLHNNISYYIFNSFNNDNFNKQNNNILQKISNINNKATIEHVKQIIIAFILFSKYLKILENIEFNHFYDNALILKTLTKYNNLLILPNDKNNNINIFNIHEFYSYLNIFSNIIYDDKQNEKTIIRYKTKYNTMFFIYDKIEITTQDYIYNIILNFIEIEFTKKEKKLFFFNNNILETNLSLLNSYISFSAFLIILIFIYKPTTYMHMPTIIEFKIPAFKDKRYNLINDPFKYFIIFLENNIKSPTITNTFKLFIKENKYYENINKINNYFSENKKLKEKSKNIENKIIILFFLSKFILISFIIYIIN
jgi:hypothetical protein